MGGDKHIPFAYNDIMRRISAYARLLYHNRSSISMEAGNKSAFEKKDCSDEEMGDSGISEGRGRREKISLSLPSRPL
jgi:hypothetical protein